MKSVPDDIFALIDLPFKTNQQRFRELLSRHGTEVASESGLKPFQYALQNIVNDDYIEYIRVCLELKCPMVDEINYPKIMTTLSHRVQLKLLKMLRAEATRRLERTNGNLKLRMRRVAWDGLYEKLTFVYPEAMIDSFKRIEPKHTEKHHERLVKKNGAQTVSLICPSTKKRVKLPVRFAECTHTRFFCGEAYVRAKVPLRPKVTIVCPICQKVSKFESLEVLVFWVDVLKGAPGTSVQLLPGGKWKASTADLSVAPSQPNNLGFVVKEEPISQDDDVPLTISANQQIQLANQKQRTRSRDSQASTNGEDENNAERHLRDDLRRERAKNSRLTENLTVMKEQLKDLFLSRKRDRVRLAEHVKTLSELNTEKLTLMSDKTNVEQELRNSSRTIDKLTDDLTVAEQLNNEVNTDQVELGIKMQQGLHMVGLALINLSSNQTGATRKRKRTSDESADGNDKPETTKPKREFNNATPVYVPITAKTAHNARPLPHQTKHKD